MTKIILDIKDCSSCPFHTTSPYPTSDSFERPEYWWCHHNDALREGEGRREVAGYVEWHDKTPIPNWCPVKVKDNDYEDIERAG